MKKLEIRSVISSICLLIIETKRLVLKVVSHKQFQVIGKTDLDLVRCSLH